MSLTIRDAARLIGKDKGYLENRLRLLRMGEDIQKMVSFRTDTLQHARLIDPITNAKLREQLIRAVIDEGISHREVQRRIEEHGRPAQPDLSSPNLSNRADTVGDFERENLSVRKDKPPSSDANSNGISVSHATDRPDPVQQALRPAVSFAAEAARQIRSISISPDYRAEILQELTRLEQQITQIRKAIK